MTFLIIMNQEELSALLQISQAAGYSPDQIDPISPYKMKGDKGIALRIAAETHFPALAAQWKADSMKQVHTLETAAMAAGVIDDKEVSLTAHNHLMETSRDYRAGYEESLARREAGWVAEMEKGAEELRQRREKMSATFQAKADNRRTGSMNVDQGVAAWNRRFRNSMNQPAKNLIR